MLERLIIDNIALIEHIDLELHDGLNVLTGETGAGKSIVIDGVNLVLGGRTNRELVSSNKPKARVEAFFDISNSEGVKSALSERGIEYEDDRLVIVREITAEGKSVSRINGEIVSLNILREITSRLVDVHGQHEHQSLLNPSNHIDIIDSFEQDAILPVKELVRTEYSAYSRLTSELNSGFVSEAERERRIDILTYQINEIDAAKLSVGEESRIKEEIELLSNSETISEALEASGELVCGERGALEMVRRAAAKLGRIGGFSAQYDELYKRIDSLYYELEDVSYNLRDLRIGYEYDPERLNELERRLDIISSLKRKYGVSIEGVLGFREEAQDELERLMGSKERRERLEKERENTSQRYFEAASELTALRKRAAKRVAEQIIAQLSDLGMKNARFDVAFDRCEGIHQNGVDRVEFMLCANSGENLKPLAKVASGGELSRIMLAMKTVLAASDGIPTLIFDEVDTGISGVTAVRVGEKLTRIAKHRQVLSITHLPQIAAFADCHLLVEKNAADDRTITTLKEISGVERTREIARIMGASGEYDTLAMQHAGSLIASAEAFKGRLTE